MRLSYKYIDPFVKIIWIMNFRAEYLSNISSYPLDAITSNFTIILVALFSSILDTPFPLKHHRFLAPTPSFSIFGHTKRYFHLFSPSSRTTKTLFMAISKIWIFKIDQNLLLLPRYREYDDTSLWHNSFTNPKLTHRRVLNCILICEYVLYLHG